MRHLRYVAFEGIDGCGKSTQAAMLGRAAEHRGITPIHLSEPSRGPYGVEIRRRLMANELGDLAEQRRLFTLDRRDHVERKIGPLLKFVRNHPGFMIVQSRSFLSAAAYQAGTDDPAVLASIIEEQNSFAPLPDLTVVLDVPVETALKRLAADGRGDALETMDNLTRVRRRYWHLAQMDPQHIIWVDGNGEPARVTERVVSTILGS